MGCHSQPTGMGVDYFGVRMGDVFNQGIHQMLSPGVCIMTLKIPVESQVFIPNNETCLIRESSRRPAACQSGRANH